MKYINKLLITVLIFTVVFTNIFVSNEKVNAEKSKGFCLFCDAKEKEAIKERQFANKIKIIKGIFKDQINSAVLAATVLYIDFSTGINGYYEEDFDSADYKKKWNNISNNLQSNSTENSNGEKLSEQDWQGSVGNEKIDLLTAATIVMLFSSGFGNAYNEDAYKKALMLNSGFTDDSFTIGPFNVKINDLFCSPLSQGVGAVATAIFGTIRTVNPFDDYSLGDTAKFIVNMHNICEVGFLEATYSNVQGIEDKEKKQKRKEKVADEIIKFADMYKKWFGIENYNGNLCLVSDLQADLLCQLHDQGNLKEWVNTFGPVAQADYSRTGVFASITMAQAILESGWGCSDIQNNLFGIKCHGYATCTTVGTQEEYNGSLVSIQDSFRTYESVAQSIEDHSKFLTENSIYTEAGVFNSSNYTEQANALQKAGYATSSSYASNLISLIQYNNLDKWDIKVNTTSSSSSCSAIGNNGWTIRTVAPMQSDVAFNHVSANRGQCVWYAQGRAIEIVDELVKNGKLDSTKAQTIKTKLLEAQGNGGEVYSVAASRGYFNVSNDIRKPKAGSYISWTQEGQYGHVAIIEDVTSDSITITEGWSTSGASCPNDWNCVGFSTNTYSLDEYYSSKGPYNSSNYKFSGYVYFLELNE